MLRIFADSGCSIKREEAERYGVEILPLKILLGDREYDDGLNLSMEEFYHALIEEGMFPKTSLPALSEGNARVHEAVRSGDDVIVLTISSGISGTHHALHMLFDGEPHIRVIDTKTAVGGIRILITELNKMRNASLDEAEEMLNALIPRLRVIAIPETLEYLHRGGRLSKTAWIAGSLAQIKPLISLNSRTGGVEMHSKALGKKRAMRALVGILEEQCDTDYPIVPSYTYNTDNVDALIAMTDTKFHACMTEYDDLDPAIACHWGPNAFGYIFVAKNADNE